MASIWRYDKVQVGERIKKRRRALAFTQEDLSEKIGKSVRFLSDVERGAAGMSLDTMLDICSVLELSPNILLLGDNQNFPYNSFFTTAAACLSNCTLSERTKILNTAIEIVLAFYSSVKK